MKITPKILSIPPHISVTWSQVRAVYTHEGILTVNLTDGVIIPIPNLTQEEIEAVFAAHAAYAAETSASGTQPHGQQIPYHFIKAVPNTAKSSGKDAPENGANPTIRMGFDNMEAFQSAMQHNPALGNIQSLPKEILGKIAMIAKIMAPGEVENMPKAEPHCNCPHCQIARAIHGEAEGAEPAEASTANEIKEEEVSDEDLKFRQWDIVQSGDKLFTVTNRLDKNEQYQVFLGQPVGCTCGHSGCEHILAVLKS